MAPRKKVDLSIGRPATDEEQSFFKKTPGAEVKAGIPDVADGNPTDFASAARVVMGETSQPPAAELSDEERELASIEAQKAKILDSIKSKLARNLSAACDNFKLLAKLGVKNVLLEPQFFDYCQTLGISDQAELPLAAEPAKKPQSSRRGRTKGAISTADAVVQALAGGAKMDVEAIFEAVTGIKGEISKGSVNGALVGLKKAGKIKSTGRGEYQKA